jgi:hypothetical protein
MDQLGGHRRRNLLPQLWIYAVEEPHTPKHFCAATGDRPLLQVARQSRQKLFAVDSPIFTILLELNDVRTDEPVAKGGTSRERL